MQGADDRTIRFDKDRQHEPELGESCKIISGLYQRFLNCLLRRDESHQRYFGVRQDGARWKGSLQNGKRQSIR